MEDLKCPQCGALLSLEEIKTKCQFSMHLFELMAYKKVETRPETVVVQCSNGHVVEVQCSEAD